MNWMCSALDSYRLVSNSDAHSPPMLGREATTFCTDLDYFAMRRALETGNGLAGTVEFFPEEGKYHLDGHRKCGIRFSPSQSREHRGDCPECGKPLTIGVLHRVAELADRPEGYRPATAAGYRNMVQLPQILAEVVGTGPKSKRVAGAAARLVAELGPELSILDEVPTEDIAKAGGTLLAEAISRLRRGEVTREAGYDGEYGQIRLLTPDERVAATANRSRGAPAGTAALFEVPTTHQTGPQRSKQQPAPVPPEAPRPTGPEAVAARPAGWQRQPEMARRPSGRRHGCAEPAFCPPGGAPAPSAASPIAPGPVGLLDDLDPDQRAAASADPAMNPALLIIAGPGTGKTRTLAYRIAHLVAERGVPADRFLAVTFTRRAAAELRERLAALMDGGAGQPTVTTFHGLGLRILREQHQAAGLPAGFGVADETARLAVAAELAGSGKNGRALLDTTDADPAERAAFSDELRARGLTDFAGLIELPARLLRDDPVLAAEYRRRWAHLSVDEYQDIDESQYGLLRLLACPDVAPGTASLTAIGDPDQAIYGFRGADVGFFLRFAEDFAGAATATLTRNYRSSPAIVASAMQAIAPGTLVPARILRPARGDASGTSASLPAGAADDAPGRVTVHEAADEQAEASWIARTIDGLLGGSSFHSLDSGRADGYGTGRLGLADIAVLYRTRGQAGLLTQALTRSGLPAQNLSHDRLADRSGAGLLLRQLRLVPGRVGDEVPAGSVADQLRAAARAATALLPAASPAAVDVRAAAEVLMPLARRCDNDLERFLTEVAVGAEADAADPRADTVTLLTLHAAKGLEFPVVFVAGCEDGLLPLRLPWAPADSGAAATATAPPGTGEERRLLFVGMTRARSRLFLTYARRRTRHPVVAAPGAGGPSPFLRAIGPGLVERSGDGGRARSRDRQLRLL
jgi:superfamily I DNA/RNA helicase